MQPGEAGLGETDLAVELVDRRLGLHDHVFLRRDLRVEAVDQRVEGEVLRLRCVELIHDVLQLLLVVDLGADSLVVLETCLVDVGRVAWVAVDC